MEADEPVYDDRTLAYASSNIRKELLRLCANGRDELERRIAITMGNVPELERWANEKEAAAGGVVPEKRWTFDMLPPKVRQRALRPMAIAYLVDNGGKTPESDVIDFG